jgi:hypothetical protein
MARIRTVKPEFFIHEGLQDLEAEHPGFYPMFVYQGLWLQCDSNGVFPWRPRQLKLYILPFLPFDMATSLDILEEAGYIVRYKVDGKEFGHVPTFRFHQRLSGKEAIDGEKYPLPCEAPVKQNENTMESQENQQGSTCETMGKQQGNRGEALGKQQGGSGEIPDAQEREREREKEKEKERERKTSCSEPKKTGSELNVKPSVISIPLVGKINDSQEFDILQSMIDDWAASYPAVNVIQELHNIRQWNIANPTRRKTKAGILRHINSWLADKQNKGGSIRGSENARGAGFKTIVSTGDRKMDISLTNAMNWAKKQMEGTERETG